MQCAWKVGIRLCEVRRSSIIVVNADTGNRSTSREYTHYTTSARPQIFGIVFISSSFPTTFALKFNWFNTIHVGSNKCAFTFRRTRDLTAPQTMSGTQIFLSESVSSVRKLHDICDQIQDMICCHILAESRRDTGVAEPDLPRYTHK